MAKDIDYGPAFDVARQMMKEINPSIQDDLQSLYWRVIFECPNTGREADNILNAFQALSEIIEFAGGGQHRDYL